LLALETTNATPIWPAIGIALTAVLLFAYRIWPAFRFGQSEVESC
jgi:integral membrane sensor domain MASE1